MISLDKMILIGYMWRKLSIAVLWLVQGDVEAAGIFDLLREEYVYNVVYTM